MNSDHYTYRVTWSAEDAEHVGLCAEFPSLSWLAATPAEALAGIRSVVADCVRDMSAHGEPVRNRQRMPFSTRRSSTRGTPRGLFGSSGAMIDHSLSVSSYRRRTIKPPSQWKA